MRVSAHRGRLYPIQQLAKRRVAGKVRAHRQRVNEKSDQTLRLWQLPARDRRADHNIFLARVTMQQNLVGRQQCHEKRHTLDRKSTRLNSSHSQISYAVFCLKKKKISSAD